MSRKLLTAAKGLAKAQRGKVQREAVERGRPLKLSMPELQARFLANLAGALYVETACAATGIHKDTYYEWCRMARAAVERLKKNPTSRATAKEKKLVALMAEVEKVMEEKQSRLISVIEAAAARGFWQSAAWLLERRWPERYAARRTGEDDVNVNVTVGYTSIEIVPAEYSPQPSHNLIEGEVMDATSVEG
jgi:transposase